MADKDMITMSRRETRRLHLVHQALEGKITQVAAAEVLVLSARQFRRLLKRVRNEGDPGICHRSRGRPSNNRLSLATKTQALRLFTRKYADFNLVHATEQLAVSHGISISDETLRLWLQEADLPYKRHRTRPHRQWRESRACFGEMVQMDGSHHDWFEGRGPSCVLMGCIDDATNTVFCRFYEYEGTLPAMDSMKRYIREYGIPQSVYLDRHSTYKSQADATIEEQLTGQEPLSHFEKSMGALEVEVIHARSPQAKGRVERLFKTLQDRLVRELRLRGIGSIAAANEYLAVYLAQHNHRFGHRARESADLHRPAPSSRELDRIFCIREERTVRNDLTISYKGNLYQIVQRTRARKVSVEKRLDGSLHITAGGKDLLYRQQSPFAVMRKADNKPPRLDVARTPKTPAADHPWRKAKPRRRRVREQQVHAP